MLTLEQQIQVEQLVNWLEELGHPIEDIFSSAKDFENPTKDILTLYTQCYITYPIWTLQDLSYIISDILSIRVILTQDLQSLGFDFDVNELYTWIKHFHWFIQDLIEKIGDLRYEQPNQKEILTEKQIQSFVENTFGRIEVEQAKIYLKKEVEKYINELRKHIIDPNPWFDIEWVISSLNTLFSSSWLVEISSGREKVQIQTKPFFYTPHISDAMCYMLEKPYYSTSIDLNSKFVILFKMLEYFWKREDFWKQIEAFRPNQEILDELEWDKIKYGAKGAYLRFLKNMLRYQESLAETAYVRELVEKLSDIKTLLSNDENLVESAAKTTKERILETIQIDRMDDFHIELLPSLEIDTELYKSWVSGKNINSELEEIYERARNELFQEDREDETDYISRKKWLPKEISGLIVRSSAVYSEDSEKTSWAWIYESVGDIYSVDDFKRAVQLVFESVESEKAQAHRKAFDIPEEYMWLVVMPFMHSTQKSMWYVNMARPWKSNLVDIKDMSGKHAVLQKDLLPIDLVTELHFWTFISHMYQVDTRSSEVWFQMSDMWLASSLKTMFFLSQYFSYPLQFEIISESSMRRERVFIVQMRPLNFQNQNLCIPEFPNQEPIYEGNAIVACDKIINVEDILIRRNSWEATIRWTLDSIEDYEAVIITDGFSVAAGHIETLCSERWIPCICENRFEQARELDLSPYKQVRIVSDGEVARIYPV